MKYTRKQILEAIKHWCKELRRLDEDIQDIEFVNLTPHEIVLNSGEIFPPSGDVARVSTSYTQFDENKICNCIFGQVTGLPPPKPNTIYIVSGLVASALKGSRNDVVSPATGHKECIRTPDKKGIVSVPGFVR